MTTTQIPIPDLPEGFEGPDAEHDAALHNCGPAEPWARALYERWQAETRTIELPQGWTASTSWWQDGKPCLTLCSPRATETFDDEGTEGRREVRQELRLTLEQDGQWSTYHWDSEASKGVTVSAADPSELLGLAQTVRTLGTSPAMKARMERLKEIRGILIEAVGSEAWREAMPEFEVRRDVADLLEAAAQVLDFRRPLVEKEVELVDQAHGLIHRSKWGEDPLQATASRLWSSRDPRMTNARPKPSEWLERQAPTM